jgi:hypothetical protein
LIYFPTRVDFGCMASTKIRHIFGPAGAWVLAAALGLSCIGTAPAQSPEPQETQAQAQDQDRDLPLAIPPSPDGGFGPKTVGWCQCFGTCNSNFTCGHEHTIYCNVSKVDDSAVCASKCKGMKDPKKRCGSNCAALKVVSATWVAELDPTYKTACIH